MNPQLSGIASAVLKSITQAVRQIFDRIPFTNRPALSFFTPSSLKRRILVVTGAVGVFATAAAIGVAPLAPDAALLPTTRIVESLALPDLNEQVEQQEAIAPDFIREEKVQRGDSVATLLNRLGVDDKELETYLRTSTEARSLYRQLIPGRTIQASTNALGEIRWLRYIHTPGTEIQGKVVSQFLQIDRAPEGLKASELQLDTERQTRVAHGEILSSLFGATDAADIPDSIATQIAEILSGDIDFHRDLRRGDHFNVIYETYHHQGTYVRAGKVIAIEFVNKGKPFQAVWFDQQAGAAGGYYTFEGKSLRKAFLRSPMEFTRVTSGFSRRFHPILKTWREHKGVDYGAPTGTTIRSTADGTVEFIGRQNGYGNVVIIDHRGQYSTLYAHMSAFAPGIKKGTRIAQGQFIGRVGSTGWATGPHLHYEFRIAGRPVDPLTVALPSAPELTARSLAMFKKETEPLHHQMALLAELNTPEGDSGTAVASK